MRMRIQWCVLALSSSIIKREMSSGLYGAAKVAHLCGSITDGLRRRGPIKSLSRYKDVPLGEKGTLLILVQQPA